MYHIGVDLGGTNLAIGILDENFQMLRKESIPTRPERGDWAVLQDMAALCRRLMQEQGLSAADFSYAGVAAPGIANQDSGIVEYNNNLGFVNTPVADYLEREVGFRKVCLENDANAAALGEALAGAGKNAKIFVMVTLGTGVGGGVVFDGRVLQGAHHVGGELGHIVMEHRNGLPCTCGRRGCIEAYCAAPALMNRTREAMRLHPDSRMWEVSGHDLEQVSARTVFEAVKRGDGTAENLLHEYLDDLACGLATIINIFDPEVLALGGGLSAAEGLLEGLIPRISRETYGLKDDREKCLARERKRVRLAELGNDAGIIGAAFLGEKHSIR